ncbi:uncharacterized protein BO80DRAFT_448523 [Aspergillus ibericus CBS 121593]|uniref:Uncharacterized protein n=1 Tax=Aspergillus ibericus CBS 121593 TaxID=1448316 RepID=A0A395GTE4_9EURO|nr:hypothetical protein BO80DRAFT_448523 [Aspergillus ibericus CBS 121593]RAK97353.1 hypothetical protein BO80DRAFT_448523 [Aspergillus ibericus CBS 121593]
MSGDFGYTFPRFEDPPDINTYFANFPEAGEMIGLIRDNQPFHFLRIQRT